MNIISVLFYKIVGAISRFTEHLNFLLLRIAGLNLILLSPILSGSFTEYARAGDSFSLPIHYGISILVFVISWALLEISPVAGLITIHLYLGLVGLIRRSLIPSTGYIQNDPLILVGTALTLTFLLRAILKKQFPQDTKIANYIKLLLIVMFVEIFNPLQGSLTTGFSGIIFRMTPVLWYILGYNKCNRFTFYKVTASIVVLGLIQALVGARQVLSGFTDVEKFWISIGGGTQIVGKGYRPVGTVLAFSEYTSLQIMASAVCWGLFLQRKYIYGIPFIILALSVFLSSSRGAVVSLVLVVIASWAVQGKTYRIWLPRLIFAAIILVWGLSFGIQKAKDVEINKQADSLITHQINGLSDPLGKASTGSSHLLLIQEGILTGLKNPIGSGLGAGTLAAGRFGTSIAGSEFDFSDMFISLGLIGGVLYGIIAIYVWKTTGQYWHETRDPVGLIVFAMLVGCQGNWLTGAHYTQVMILWLGIGCIDKEYKNYKNTKNMINI